MSSGGEEEPVMANVEKNGVCDGKLHGKNTPEARTLEKGQTVSPGKGSREAQEAASRSDEEQETMDDEVRRLPEELAEVKTGLKDIVATANGEMPKALVVKDEAIKSSDLAQACFQAVERATARKEARAATAEHQLSRATEKAGLLRTRLEEMFAELEVARSAMFTTTEAGGVKHVDESSGEVHSLQCDRSRIESRQELCSLHSGPSFPPSDRSTENTRLLRTRLEEMAAELEVVRSAISNMTEAGSVREDIDKPVGERLVREAFEGEVPITFESADEVASVRDAAEKARHRADQLQAELDWVNQEAGKLREALEGARELHRLAEKREVDSTNLVEEAARNELEKAEKDCEIQSLKVRLEQSEEALREAKRSIASMEESTRREASLKPAALEERKGEGEAREVALTEVVDSREEAERLAAEDNSARDGELNSLREGLEILRAELASAKALASTASENAAAAEAATASRIAGLEARLDGAEAAQELKVAHLQDGRPEATAVFVKSEEVEVKGWRDKAERAVRETQAERKRAMEAAAAADPAREGMMLMEHESEEEAAEAVRTTKQDDDDDGDDDYDDDEKEENEKEKSSKKRKSKEAENGEAKKRQANTREKATIYVKGLPWDTPDEEVKNFFKACGKIESIDQPMGHRGRYSGTASVTFDNIAAALKAIEMDGQELGGRWLKITMAIQKPKPDGCMTVFIGNLSWSIDEMTD